MRHGIQKLLVASIALAGLVAAAAPARAEEIVLVNVPFDFVAGPVQFTAGKYEVTKLDDQFVMSIRRADGSQSAFVMSQVGEVPDGSADPELVFDKYENGYRLATVSFGADARQLPIPHPAAEQKIAQVIIHSDRHAN